MIRAIRDEEDLALMENGAFHANRVIAIPGIVE